MQRIGSSTLFVELRNPCENTYVESFNDKCRVELLADELFTTIEEARYRVDRYRTEYNTRRPRSGLDSLIPLELAARCALSGYSSSPSAKRGSGQEAFR
ncbi:MAG: integrase core domain-containing protein, partial [Planctomycetota bacterium]